jgi:hypothetical protein
MSTSKFIGLLVFGLSLVSGHAQSTASASGLQFSSSDKNLTEAFRWAKSQALVYVHNDADPVGSWYEAALPGRNAFCMRDVAHQTTGAAALGLYPQNHNMLKKFAAAVSPSRDWAGYWEIDKTGRPSPADYIDDNDFWYNLPANFDILDSIVRMWHWTGDETYLADPAFERFFQSMAAYIQRWDLQPLGVLDRPRIMNQRIPSGQFVLDRGIPSYSEGRTDFNLGTDLLAAEYRAFESLRDIDLNRHEVVRAQRDESTAHQILYLIDHKAWSDNNHHFMGFFSRDGTTQGSGDVMVLYFGATQDQRHIQQALSYIGSQNYWKHIGIEEESYLPQTFYRYGTNDSAYAVILDLVRPGKQRRDYPEVSFSVIGAIVKGTMGIEASRNGYAAVISSIARLPRSSDNALLCGLHIGHNLVDIRHVGSRESSLTNRSGPTLHWRAEFAAKAQILIVNGRRVRSTISYRNRRVPVSWIITDVPAGATIVVSRPGPISETR